jgi:hypothetical protein
MGTLRAKFTLRCIRLLVSIPLLEELFLLISFVVPETPESGFETLQLQLPKLKYFYLNAACADCAALLLWFSFNPGCVVDINCTKSDVDEDCETVRNALYYYAVDSKLDVTGKCITIHVERRAMKLIVWPTSSQPPSN